MNYQDFINPELLILIPVLYIVGVGLKKLALFDRFIPLILGAFSVTLCAVYVLATSDILELKDIAIAIFTAITQGIMIAGSSVYANQIFKQATKKDK